MTSRRRTSRLESLVLSAISDKGVTGTELNSTLPGSPDIFFPIERTAVFIHGCYWHSHYPCRIRGASVSNSGTRSKALADNVRRDQRVGRQLSELGIKVIVIWECSIRFRLSDVVESLLLHVANPSRPNHALVI